MRSWRTSEFSEVTSPGTVYAWFLLPSLGAWDGHKTSECCSLAREGRSMRKVHLVVLTALVAVALATALPASAITNGQAAGDAHPYVGLVVFDVINAAGQQVPSHRCSGSLLTPTVFLTA